MQYCLQFGFLLISAHWKVLGRLTCFRIVLIAQNRAAKIEDLRQEIDLQLNTISEKEITKIMEMLSKIMQYHKLDISNDAMLKEMLKPTDMEKLENDLNKQL